MGALGSQRRARQKKAEATGVRIEGFTASELADVERALTWISQNKESSGATPA